MDHLPRALFGRSQELRRGFRHIGRSCRRDCSPPGKVPVKFQYFLIIPVSLLRLLLNLVQQTRHHQRLDRRGIFIANFFVLLDRRVKFLFGRVSIADQKVGGRKSGSIDRLFKILDAPGIFLGSDTQLPQKLVDAGLVFC